MAGLQAYLAFLETVKRGNFAAAGREMGMSASAVAKSIGRLETDLGIRLFHRTTRQVTLTSDGQMLFERCKRITDEIEALRDEAASARSEPSGVLRINVPVVIGRTLVVPVLAQLLRRHPRLELDVSYSDRYVDLVKDGLDAAIRIGHLKDSTLIGHAIGEQSLVICGAPDYLEQRGIPKKPADIAQHSCLMFRALSSGQLRSWQLYGNRKLLELKPPTSVVMNDGEALVAAAASGMGLIQVPSIMVAHEINAGRLIPLLEAYRAPPQAISIVYPSARRIPLRLRAFIELLTVHEASWRI